MDIIFPRFLKSIKDQGDKHVVSSMLPYSGFLKNDLIVNMEVNQYCNNFHVLIKTVLLLHG